MLLKWSQKLAPHPLCGRGESCTDTYMVNAVGISDDASRLVAGTYYQNYDGAVRVRDDGTYGMYVYDTAGTGTRLFESEYKGNRGIYDVAISGDGKVVACGGLFSHGSANPFKPKRGIVRAFEVSTQKVLLDSTDFPARVNAVALSRDGGVLAAVAEFFVYVFIRQTSGLFPAAPHAIPLGRLQRCPGRASQRELARHRRSEGHRLHRAHHRRRRRQPRHLQHRGT